MYGEDHHGGPVTAPEQLKISMPPTPRVLALVQNMKRVTSEAALELNRQSTTDAPPEIGDVLRNTFAHAYLMGVEDGFTGIQKPLPLEELLKELELQDYWATERKRRYTPKASEEQDEEKGRKKAA